eukprot:TRINITY_DN3077_c0_g1_i1.p1 TRINITY_DN3077_c0_g1~~TRINITY_DN3077_c0_g1_i1.p1  ORF type:complete len:217 (+),score=7.50 TRINITY_DN3077_c0_g1_i1:85-735(+)
MFNDAMSERSSVYSRQSSQMSAPPPWVGGQESGRPPTGARLMTAASGRSMSSAASRSSSARFSDRYSDRAESMHSMRSDGYASSRMSRRSDYSDRSGYSRRSQMSSGSAAMPPPTPYQVPTRSVMGHESCASSDTCSTRTATTIREFFDDERRWVSSASARGRGGSVPAPRNRLPTVKEDATPDVCAGVLPGVPRGKVPGCPPRRKDHLFAPHPCR